MGTLVKRIDQIRHEMKALRYLLEFHPASLEDAPAPDDFRIPDSRRIYDALRSNADPAAAASAIAALGLEETDVDSFLRLSGTHYHTYPALVRERAEQFRRGELTLEE
jgi:hypothetical protein